MIIHLPADLESLIRAEVMSGHFASEDDMVATAVRDYLQRRQDQPQQVAAAPGPADKSSKRKAALGACRRTAKKHPRRRMGEAPDRWSGAT